MNYLTPDEIATRYGVKVNTVTGWIRSGKLKAQKLGRLWRIAQNDFEEFLSTNHDKRKKRTP